MTASDACEHMFMHNHTYIHTYIHKFDFHMYVMNRLADMGTAAIHFGTGVSREECGLPRF